MQERNPYKIPPNFDSLAQPYPPLRPQSVLLSALVFFFPSLHLLSHSISRTSDNGPPTVDFHDETAQRSPRSPFVFHSSHIYPHRRLTQALLRRTLIYN